MILSATANPPFANSTEKIYPWAMTATDPAAVAPAGSAKPKTTKPNHAC